MNPLRTKANEIPVARTYFPKKFATPHHSNSAAENVEEVLHLLYHRLEDLELEVHDVKNSAQIRVSNGRPGLLHKTDTISVSNALKAIASWMGFKFEYQEAKLSGVKVVPPSPKAAE